MYKSAKEAFVSNNTGSSVSHISLLSLSALLSLSCSHPRLNNSLLLSWAVLVLPLLLSISLFANRPLSLHALLLILFFFTHNPRPISLPSNHHHAPSKLPALSNYRAHMILLTVLSILAVDFPVFPRSLAKCESYGASLMDLGVGSFVFSQGLVSAIPLIKNPYYLSLPFLPKVLTVTLKSLPIIVLGLIRVLLVKATEYPEHVTEYGVHWNFFITLALLPIFQSLLHPVFQRVSISLVGFALAIVQEILLSTFHLKQYVLFAPRTSVISANKEGIVSLLGYLSIHVLGLSIGTIVLAPTPSFFSRRQKALRNKTTLPELNAPRQTVKISIELCAYAILFWFFLWATKIFGIGGQWGDQGGISRRMVNLPYILWTTAYNMSFLFLYILLDLWVFKEDTLSSSKKKKHIPKNNNRVASSPIVYNPPKLLGAINAHGLAIFLIANLLTGMINLSLPTMYMENWSAMCVLGLYSILISAVAWYWPRMTFTS